MRYAAGSGGRGGAIAVARQLVALGVHALLVGDVVAALGFGAGSETNQPLAVAVVGGMISSTLLTLVVVPAVYSLVEGWRERRRLAAAP